jgi:hypothetical protein
MKNKLKPILFYLILIGIMFIVIAVTLGGSQRNSPVFNEIWELFLSEQVKSFEIDERSNLLIVTHSNEQISYKIRDMELFFVHLTNLINQQYETGIIEKYTIASPVDTPWWISMLPYLIIIGIAGITVVLIKIIKKNKSGGNI